jgi:hypothetical protein
VRNDDPNTLVVAVDGNGDGKADHLFHLVSDDVLGPLNESFQRAHIEFSGRTLRVLATERRMVITLALSSEPAVPESPELSSVRYSGYGLNHEMGPQVQKFVLR